MEHPAPNVEKLSRYQKFHLTLMILGLCATCGTLFFLARQVNNFVMETQRQTVAIDLQRQAVQGQVWSAVGQNDIELSKVLIANPKMLPYFHRGRSISSRDRNYDLVMAIADMYLSYFDSLFNDHIRVLPDMGPNGRYW